MSRHLMGKDYQMDRNRQESKTLTPEMQADIQAAASARMDEVAVRRQ
jgi:hypothetical protein